MAEDRSAGDEAAARIAGALDLGSLERSRLFAGPYRQLFKAMVVSSLGDWVGFLAVASLAARVGKSNADVAVGVVLSARLLPGFFFGAIASALLDRWDRKKVMVICDIGRGLIVGVLPFVHSILGLFLASIVLEVLTLLWTPAKEATVPNVVPTEQLANANSASLAAAYGSIVPALAIFPALTAVAGGLAEVDVLRFFHQKPESIAIAFDVVTFLVSAFLISRLALPQRTVEQKAAVAGATLASTWRDAKDGWRFIGTTYRVRAVVIGFCTGMIGGGMVVPLGVTYSDKVLHKGPTGFGLLAMALGVGASAAVLALSVWQKRVSHEGTFGWAVTGAGVCVVLAASTSNLALSMLGIGLFGVCAGSVYVLGFTILGSNTTDDMRGRIFGVFYALVRLCLLLAFTLAPFLSGVLDGLSSHLHRHVGRATIKGEVGTSSWHLALPGTRLTLWLGGVIILLAAWTARRDLRRAEQQVPVVARDSPVGPGDPAPDGEGGASIGRSASDGQATASPPSEGPGPASPEPAPRPAGGEPVRPAQPGESSAAG